MSAGSPTRHVEPPPPKPASLDPSLISGDSPALITIDFDQEFTLDYRGSDRDMATRFVRFRILTMRQGDGDVKTLTSVRFELLDDADLNYFVEAAFHADQFQAMKDTTGLLVEFEDFSGEVQGLLKDALKTESEITVTFWEEDDGRGALHFNQLLDVKCVEILKIIFEPSTPEFIAHQIQYRYEKLRFELERRKLMLRRFRQEMQMRNPVLYKQIDPPQRSPPRK